MKRLIVLAPIIVLFLGLAAYLFAPTPALDESWTFPTDRAVWMGVTWSMDKYSDAEIASLAQDLQSQQVDYAFVYVSYLKPRDFFNPTYDHAAQFTQRLRRAAPDIKILSWIGVPITAENAQGVMAENRLNDPHIRKMIAEFAAMTVTALGFDGVHLNAELIPNNDKAFLETLQSIRNALPTNAILSTTAHALRSDTQVTSIPYPIIEHHWSPEYLRQVASLSDQVALMAYDSGLIFPADYRSWMTYQVSESTKAMHGLDTYFLIGLPTSEEWTPSHHIHAETLSECTLWLTSRLRQYRKYCGWYRTLSLLGNGYSMSGRNSPKSPQETAAQQTYDNSQKR